jgi:mRNA-degrading endonuclease RelE of RelBE toxin-antitoxin system
MSYKVVSTRVFEQEVKRLAKKYKSLKAEIAVLFEDLEENPAQGTPLGSNCYKIRLAISSKQKGKSGGARVITCVKVVQEAVILLTI